MTQGRLFPLLVKFTIPLVLGNLLQLTYNAVDSIIVGRFVGADALAAVGTSNPLMTLIVLFLNGISLGAGILIGTMYGAKQYDRLKRQVSTGMVAGMIFSVVLSVIFILTAAQLLKIMQIDPSILDEAVRYLRVISVGLIFTFIYNYLASTLRALGDSRSPLYFLAISAFLNIFGDLLFVVKLRMGIEGAAIATVVSEALSGVLCWIYIIRKIPILNLRRRWLTFDLSLLKLTVQYGFVSAMQQATVQMGKLGIQTIVNTMGVESTAAFNAVNRADDYAVVVEQNIAHSMTSVMAQNRGAGQMSRVRTSFRYGLYLELAYGVLSGIVFFVFAVPLMQLFTTDTEVVRIGAGYLRLIAFMYILPAITNGVQGYFRGMGDLKITLISSLINMGVRVAAAIPLVFGLHMDMEAIPWSYLIGWGAMMAYEIPYMIYMMRRHKDDTGAVSI
jgi:putative MATE family efflux protein